MKELARNLRKNQTDAEKRLWRYLRDRRLTGLKFRRQYVIKPYIVDFACVEKKLVIEIDGGQHAENVEADHLRTRYLEEKGYKVVRFWNNEMLTNTDAVLNNILSIMRRSPLILTFSPGRGEGTNFLFLVGGED